MYIKSLQISVKQQGCRFTKIIGRAHQLRPLADPADRLGGGGGGNF